MPDSDAKQTASGTLVLMGPTPDLFLFKKIFCFCRKRVFIVLLIGGKEGPIIGCLSPLARLTGKPDHWVATPSN